MVLILLSACGSLDGTATGLGAGSVSARLVFPGQDLREGMTPLALDTSAVYTVRLSAVKGTKVYVTRDFLFSAGSGTLDGVPVGSDYEIRILALDQNGIILYSKRVFGVAVTAGADTPLGSVQMIPAEGLLYFLAAPGPAATVRTLWSYDGFSARIHSAMGQGWDLGPDIASFKGFLFFGAMNTVGSTVTSGLWSCDGKGDPVLVRALEGPPDGTVPSEFCVYRNVLYFSAYEASAGQELWRSDGTTAGTSRVADIRSGTEGSDPRDLTVFGGRLFFSAATAAAGTELFHYTGTGSPSAVDLVTGASSGRPSSLFPSLDGLYFSAADADLGQELWAIDSTATAFTVVSDIRPGAAGSLPRDYALLEGTIYFPAAASAAETELWSSSGWAEGATLAANVNPSGSADPRDLAVLGGRLYFAGRHATVGEELMSYHPYTGAALAADANLIGDSSPRSLKVYDRRLFFAGELPGSGRELCVYDGDVADLAHELVPGVDGGDPSSLVAFNPDDPPLYDLSGDWFFDGPLDSGACGSFGETAHRAVVSQAGSGVVVNTPSFTFNGVLRGGTLSWSESFSDPGGTVSASFILTVDSLGEHMAGSATWTRTASGVPCSVGATVNALKY